MTDKEFLDAFREYSGGKFTPKLPNPTWSILKTGLEKLGASPREFCWFAITELDKERPVNPCMLMRKYYIAGPVVMEAFKQYRKFRKADCTLLYKIQVMQADHLVFLYDTYTDMLIDDACKFADWVKLEIALEKKETENVQRVLDKYLPRMSLVWGGIPELKLICPRLCRVLEEGAF